MTVRLRLTLVYALMFLVAGGGLLAISYGILAQKLPSGVSALTAQDIRNRAAKLASESQYDDTTRQTLKRLTSASDEDIRKFASTPQTTLPPSAAKPLLPQLPNTVRSDALSQLITSSLIALAVVGVASVGLAWFLAGQALRPLSRIAASAQALSANSLDQRIALQGPHDEVKRLADTIDEMLGRLHASFEGQRRFVANASHELRTPLTIIQTEMDVTFLRPNPEPAALVAMTNVIREATARSERILNSLLALATAEHGLDSAQPVDLATIVAEVANRHHSRLAPVQLDLKLELAQAIVVGDAGLLDRLAENLIDNAIRHNRPHGRITISTATDGTLVRLTVEATGDLVPAEQAPELFEPFRRLAQRTGPATSTGLGLSIVRAIAQAHHATATAWPLEGGGLAVAITFLSDPRPTAARPSRQQLPASRPPNRM